LLSGSWDCKIKVWDIRNGSLFENDEHIADVYGIASHPERPFVYISSSRDTTLRIWSLKSLV
jgi:WD40 repeat protein